MSASVTNPLDYPAYVRSLRPALPESLGQYVEDELEKLQNANDNMALAAGNYAEEKVADLKVYTDGYIATAAATFATHTDLTSATSSLNTSLQAYTNTQIAAYNSSIQVTIGPTGTLASSISSLGTTVGGHTSTLTTYGTSIAGLQAKAGVKLDVNGYVVGWELNNGGGSGTMDIRVDKFRIIDPSNTAVVPFQVVGGVTYIDNVVIKNSSLDSTKIAPAAVGTTQLASQAATTPKIANRAVTTSWSQATASTTVGAGFGFAFTPITIPITLTADADLTIIGTGRQSYSSSSFPLSWAASIRVNGTAISSSQAGGAGFGTDSFSMAGAISLTAGSYTITYFWTAAVGISLTNGALIVNAAYK